MEIADWAELGLLFAAYEIDGMQIILL